MKRYIVAALCTAVLLPGCNKGKTVATIGTDRVTVPMVEARIQEAPPAYQNYLTTAAGKKQFLDLMVRERIVLAAARQAGTTAKDEFKKSLATFKKEQAKRVKEYEENLLMEMYMRDLHEKQLKTTDQDVDKYYEEHKAEYDRPLEIQAQHILTPTREEAEKALARLKAGEDFGAVAKEVSSDPVSAARGGQIGPFRRGELVPEFENVVFPLKMKTISDSVETQFGFHIIKKVSERVLPARPADEAKAEIRKVLEKSKFDTWLDDTKKKLGVSVDYAVLNDVQKAADPSEAAACPPDAAPAAAAPSEK
jgi:parvulin-like peptidyl-prolyl isomerase